MFELFYYRKMAIFREIYFHLSAGVKVRDWPVQLIVSLAISLKTVRLYELGNNLNCAGFAYQLFIAYHRKRFRAD